MVPEKDELPCIVSFLWTPGARALARVESTPEMLAKLATSIVPRFLQTSKALDETHEVGLESGAAAAQVRWSSCGDRLAAVGRGGAAATWRLDAPQSGGLAHADWLSHVWPRPALNPASHTCGIAPP